MLSDSSPVRHRPRYAAIGLPKRRGLSPSRHWTATQDAKLLELARDTSRNGSFAAIAEHFGKPIGSVRARVQVLRQRAAKAMIEAEIEAQLALTRKLRRCLACGTQFMSAGPHNRICEGCSVINSRVAGAERHLDVAEHYA